MKHSTFLAVLVLVHVVLSGHGMSLAETVEGLDKWEYRNNQLHYSLSLPRGWMEIPKDVVDSAANATSQQTGLSTGYETAFQRVSDQYFTYPYILVKHIHVQHKLKDGVIDVPLSELARQLNIKQKRAIQKIEKMDTTTGPKNLQNGQIVIDSQRKIILTNFELPLGERGTIRSLCAYFPGRYDIVGLFFYVFKHDEERYLSHFDHVLSSFAFEPGYQYVEPAPSSSPLDKAVGGAIVGLFVALLFGLIKLAALVKNKKTAGEVSNQT